MKSRSKVRQRVVGVACAVLLAWLGIVWAEEEVSFPPPVDAEDRAEILSWVCDTLSARYVESEVARAMVDEVRARAAAGAYDDLGGAESFLHAVEQDLGEVSHDKHVGLWAERPEDTKGEDTDYTPADPEYVARMRRTNYGFRKVELLPGNVGYLRIDEFAHAALGGPTAVAVMNAVGSVDALIIDLRWNGGGAGLVDLISSYFFDEPAHLNDSWERATGKTQQSWTAEWVPGPSLSRVPLYILIGGQTFSAAEAFTYGLQQLDRATVVGERSKGGGHPVEIDRMARDGMTVAMMVPNAKSINHVSGTSWEGVGVAPDIEVPALDALEAAYNAAVDELLERANGEQGRRRIEWGRQQFLATLHPVTLTHEQLHEYAGVYETRAFSVGADGVLLYQRDAGSTFPMVAMGGDLFRFEGYDEARFLFERDDDGKVDRVVRLSADGSRMAQRRTGD